MTDNEKRVEIFKKLTQEIAELYEKKNANYGNSFGELFEELGPISGLVPLHNKLNRATTLVKGDKCYFESLLDTFKDLASYALMNIVEREMQSAKLTKAIESKNSSPDENKPHIITDKELKVGYVDDHDFLGRE